jgi:transposase
VRLAVACLSGEGERLIACRDRLTGFCAVHKRTAGEEKILRCLAPVFGVRLSRNGATLELLEDMRAHEAVELPTLKKIWREVFYTDHCLGFDGLLFSCCRRFRENRYLPLADSPVSLDSREGFWSFARRQLENYHCLSPENFPLYLKEQEFRYAHRQGDLVSALLAALCAFVPNLWH